MKAQGRPQDFERHQRVRYRPGKGTYGYEDVIEADGRIAAIVMGHSPTRVRIELQRKPIARSQIVCVDAASLSPVQVS